MNETSVSSISTDWSIQSLSIKSDLPIFIDLLIDESIPIFIDWLLRDISDGVLLLGNFRGSSRESDFPSTKSDLFFLRSF